MSRPATPQNWNFYSLRSQEGTASKSSDPVEVQQGSPLRQSVPAIQDNQATLTMAGIQLELFSGEGQDSSAWWEKLVSWKSFHNFSDGKALHAVPFFLTGQAKLWYDGLPQPTKEDFKTLKESFVGRFQGSSRYSTEIYSMKQGPCESAQSFLTKLQVKSRDKGLPSEALVALGLNGLQSEVKKLVIQKEPKTFEDLVHSANLAEQANTCGENSMSEVKALFQTMKDSFLAEIHAAMTPRHQNAEPQNVNQHCQQKQQSQYQKRQEQYQQQPQHQQQPLYQHQPQYHQQPMYQQQPEINQQPQYQQQPLPYLQQAPYQQQQQLQQPWNGPNRHTQQQQQYHSRSRGPCYYCGKSSCLSRNTCPARNAACHFCDKLGHFSSVCRQKLKNNQ